VLLYECVSGTKLLIQRAEETRFMHKVESSSMYKSCFHSGSPPQHYPDAMTKRPWSLRPRLFKTSLDHYVLLKSLIWSLSPLYVMSLVWNVPGCLRFLYVMSLIITSLDHKIPWSQCPLDTMIRIFVQNIPWTKWSDFWETKFTHVSLVNFALT
jgi:hypothetical protein